jgi:hypothetical protein
VLGYPSSHTDVFLSVDTCASSNEVRMTTWNQESQTSFGKIEVMGGIPFKNVLNSQSETVCQILQLLT